MSLPACLCDEGAANSSCTSDGQCYCLPGVGGAKCDLCEPFYFNLSLTGCEGCGDCVEHLVDNLAAEDRALHNVSETINLLMQLPIVEMQGLAEVDRVAREVEEAALRVGETIEDRQNYTQFINDSYISLLVLLTDIEERVSIDR